MFLFLLVVLDVLSAVMQTEQLQKADCFGESNIKSYAVRFSFCWERPPPALVLADFLVVHISLPIEEPTFLIFEEKPNFNNNQPLLQIFGGQ